MAWQLIYTSAPRLLDAGRTGFGTVARHREIPPLVVQAVERFSQFARLPGLDPSRVIHAHRIVHSAGVRFHVLSRIRSAGSDYTGRTNHIAHHLIITQREAAACALAGLTPADVLASFAWRDSWSDAARMLEKADEVNLAALPPAVPDAGAWAAITGNATHAWLLMNGRADRGCSLLVPPGVDLLRLFRESSHLTPEAAWQGTFTTVLEPTDQAGELGWVGVEAGSPLAGELQTSGRPCLDLSRPTSLPEPEVPKAAPPATQRSASAPATPSAGGRAPATTRLTGTSSAPAAHEGNATLAPDAWAAMTSMRREPISVERKEKSSIKKWVAAAAIVVLSALTVGIGMHHRMKERDAQVTAWLGVHAGQFDEGTRKQLLALPEDQRREACQFAGAMMAALLDDDADPQRVASVAAPSFPLPEEMQQLRKVQNIFAELLEQQEKAAPRVRGLGNVPPVDFLVAETDATKSKLNGIRPEDLPEARRQHFENALHSGLKSAISKGVLATLQQPAKPAHDAKWWLAQIKGLQSTPINTPNTPAVKLNLEKAHAIATAWEKDKDVAKAQERLQTANAGPLPAWLAKNLSQAPPVMPPQPAAVAQASPPSVPAPPQPKPAPAAVDPLDAFPSGAIYVLRDANALKIGQVIAELREGIQIQIVTGGPPQNLTGRWALKDFGEPLLKVDLAAKKVSLAERSDHNWSQTREIRGWDKEQKVEVFRIFLADKAGENKPLLPNPMPPLTAKVTGKSTGILKLDMLPHLLPRLRNARVFLQLPDDLRTLLNGAGRTEAGIEMSTEQGAVGTLLTQPFLAKAADGSKSRDVAHLPSSGWDVLGASPLLLPFVSGKFHGWGGRFVAAPRSKNTNTLDGREKPTPSVPAAPMVSPEQDPRLKAQDAVKSHPFFKDGPAPGTYWLKVSVGGKDSTALVHFCNIEIKP